MFSIHSVNSDRELTFSSYQVQQFQVEFKGSGLTAFTGVWIDHYVQSLITFFEELARFPSPWQGVRKWESLERYPLHPHQGALQGYYANRWAVYKQKG